MNTYTRKHADTHEHAHTHRHKYMSIPHHLSLSLFSENIPLTEPEASFALSCTDNDEDEFSSLWSTTSSFIILFLLSLTYSTVLSLVKVLTPLISCDCRLLMKAIGSWTVMIWNEKIRYQVFVCLLSVYCNNLYLSLPPFRWSSEEHMMDCRDRWV